MSTENLNITNLIGYKLKQTQHALRLHMDKALNAIELTTPQYAVLAQLELKPGISNASLARLAFITPQTMHGIVSNLERRGIIQRKSDPNHGKILCTELTKKGHKILEQAHQRIKAVESRMMATMDEQSERLFEKFLITCFNNLNG